jgi:hypothetical protein
VVLVSAAPGARREATRAILAVRPVAHSRGHKLTIAADLAVVAAAAAGVGVGGHKADEQDEQREDLYGRDRWVAGVSCVVCEIGQGLRPSQTITVPS